MRTVTLIIIHFLLFVAISGNLCFSEEMPSTVRVRILDAHNPSSLVIETDKGKVFLPDGISVFSGECRIALSGQALIYQKDGKHGSADMIRIEADRIRVVHSECGKRTYRGAVEIYPDGKKLLVINESPFEEYVHGAAVSESGELLEADKSAAAGWEKEFLSAMEICIRSYVVSNGRRHADRRYSFCDLTHCVHFSGVADRLGYTKDTVLADRKGKVIPAFFHSTCGGRLGSPSGFWPGAGDGTFRTGEDSVEGIVLCSMSPHYRWRSFLSLKDMTALFGMEPASVRLIRTGERVTALAVESEAGKKTIPVSEFLSAAGRRLGWNIIKSNDFTITRTPEGFLFEGRGLGHGAGLCQYGARTLAKKGWNASKILAFYFPGSVMSGGGQK